MRRACVSTGRIRIACSVGTMVWIELMMAWRRKNARDLRSSSDGAFRKGIER